MKIAQYLDADSWGSVTPSTINKGLGGRETALIHLAENWAKKGHEVINFVPVEESEKHNAYYVDINMAGDYLGNFGADVLISWEEPRIFGVEDIRKRTKLGIIEMQVAHLKTYPELDQVTDAYAVLSPWASEFLSSQIPGSESKTKVFPNGVDLSRYPAPSYGKPNPPYQFFYSSSPDRGLHHLLRIWPRIREMWPGSTLVVAYGVESWAEKVMWSHSQQAEVALDVLEGIKQEGVIYKGRIGQDQLAKIQVESAALLYPCDTMSPTETGCITVVEAGAACTPSVITDCDCLAEEFGKSAIIAPRPFKEEAFLNSIEILFEEDGLYESLQKRGRELAESRSWDLISEQWLEFFEERLN